MNELIESFDEIHRFITPLSQGILNQFVPHRKNVLASPFKELNARLAHLTWQAERVAQGDYSQRVDFMGEFSSAFNTMIGRLQARENLHLEYKEELEATVKERTAELRQSQQRLELALWGAELGTWDWNVCTGETVFNRQWAEMLGYAPNEIEARIESWEQLVHPEDIWQVRHTLQKNLEGEFPFYECEHRLRTKTGQWKWILARGNVVERDQRGQALRHVGTHLDIDERKRAVQELLLCRDNLEVLVAQRTGELGRANESLKSEIRERRQAEEELERSRADLSASLRELESVNLHLEQQSMLARRMAKEAETANIAKSQFLANMSHEIRTPMNHKKLMQPRFLVGYWLPKMLSAARS